MARIALVLNAAWNVYNFRLGLLDGLEKAGHTINVIAPPDSYVSRIPYPFYPIKMNPKGVNPLEDILLLFRLLHAYKSLRPDVILHYTPKPNIYGSLAASMLGIPSICNVAGLGTGFEGRALLPLILRTLYKTAFRFPHKIFFQNHEDRATLLGLHIVSSTQADHVPGSGVPLDRLKPGPFRRNAPFAFLFVSRLLRQKGVTDFIEAAAIVKKKYPDTAFKIAGFLDVSNPGAISADEMDTWIAQGNIEYLGQSDDVPSIMRECDCVVLPTYYREGVPRVLLEASALGKPLIATDIAGCKDLLEDGKNGFFCRPRDPENLANQMIRILSLSDYDLHNMGSLARIKVEKNFDEKIVINKYLSAIQSAL